MKKAIFLTTGLFALTMFCQLSGYGQTPTPSPLRRPTSVNTATPPPTAKSTTPQDGSRKAQASIQNAKLILPDLVVKQIKLLPGTVSKPTKGLTVLVANIGGADADAGFYVQLELFRNSSSQHTYWKSWESTGPLAKGAARYVNFENVPFLNDGLTTLIWQVTATADVGEHVAGGFSWTIGGKKSQPGNVGFTITESNEKNNTLSPKPDTIKP